MTINTAALDLIKRSEGWVDHAYPDPASGGEPWTIGYGHTSAAGPPKVTKGMQISRADGETILARDLEAVESTVRSVVKVPLTDNQFGALISFTFNLGPANLRSSTLLTKLNAGDYAGAADEFGRWVHGGGKVMPGLVKRRAAEKALFLTPEGAATPQAPVPATPEATKPPTGLLAGLVALLLGGGLARPELWWLFVIIAAVAAFVIAAVLILKRKS